MRKRICTIAVTGACGFIGSEFVRQAVDAGYHVAVLDKLTYAGDRARIESLKGKISVYKTDICNKEAVTKLFNLQRPEFIVNFAAETHVDRSILGSDEFIRTNIQGVQVMLDAAKEANVKRFVHLSTDEVYGDILKGQFFETTPLNPSSPYSASKAAADLLIQSYMRTFDFPALIVRPSNNYGPWQYPEKFIPVVIYKALSGEKIPVYGKGTNVREWLFVSDCARGILAVMERGKLGQAYNIGSGVEMKNIDLVKAILKYLGVSQDLIQFVKDRPGHDLRYRLNCDKLRKETGWKPQVDFETGIARTIDWYQHHLNWVKAKAAYLRGYWQKVYRKA